MKLPLRRIFASLSAIAVLPLAQAHPGHDGDHGLTWDFEHLVDHPVATILCFAVLLGAGWAGWRLAKARVVARFQPVRRD